MMYEPQEKKTTALLPSVGADDGQPLHNSTEQSIPHEAREELYQTAYKSRPPVIDGLLYSGAYILAGAPRHKAGYH